MRNWLIETLLLRTARSAEIAINFPLTEHTGAFETPVYLSDGTRSFVENQDDGKVMVIAVPAGQDGKVWWLDRLSQPDDFSKP